MSALTAAQEDAISHYEGNLQVLACAGSGKTEVLARHVAHLLSGEVGARPANIVAFTFTEKAAAELKERILSRTSDLPSRITGLADMFIGTIHGYCLNLLKTDIPRFLKYDILNEVQQFLFIDRHSKRSGLTTTKTLQGAVLRRFVDTKRYIDALSILRESELRAENLSDCSAMEGLKAYDVLLDERGYLDYSSILVHAVSALETEPVLRERIAANIKHVIVDEYQDVNPIQERLVRVFCQLGAVICVVGDDDQTIYQWRGGDVQNILTFADNYDPVRQIKLQENFRSSRAIVHIAREFIAQNVHRLDKEMIPTEAQEYEPGDVAAIAFDTPAEEGEWIAKKIEDLRGLAFDDRGDGKRRGLAYSDMAILLRSVRANGEPIISALKAAKLPYVIKGMNNLFDTAEAQAARQLFYFMIEDPTSQSEELLKAWIDADLGLETKKMAEAVSNAGALRLALHRADEAEERWSLYNLQRQFLAFIADIGLLEEAVPGGRGDIVLYNLGKFSQLISDFEAIHFHSKPFEKYKTFAQFLRFGANEAYPEGWQENEYANPDAVQIMTVHQAKGMQWPAVFVPALLNNRFPSPAMGGPSAWHIIPPDGVVDSARYKGSLEDERRLFYVAVTRAQKFLYMTWAPITGKHGRYTKASEFWHDVLSSKFVKRRSMTVDDRARLAPQQRSGVSNVVFSFSDLKYFFECPYQFRLRVLYGFNPPIHEALGFGKSLHDALAEVHSDAIRGIAPTVDDVPGLLRTHFHAPYAYKALKATLEASAREIIKNYITDNERRFSKIEFSEKNIELSLGDGVSVVGRIDLVRRLDNDEITIVDLKSNERTQPEQVTEAQLHVYALGYEELTGRNADFVETYELNERQQRRRSVDQDFIEEVKSKVRAAATDLRTGQFEKVAKEQVCKACDYRRMCSVGRKYSVRA